MKRTSLGLLAISLAAAAGVSQAEEFRLQGDYWGNTTSPNGWRDSSDSFGRLPGSGDDAIASTLCSPNSPCASVYLADVNTKAPIQADVRSFDGSGRRLYIDAGGQLSATRESQAGGLTLSGGQLTTFSEFTVGTMTVNDGGVLKPSMITGPGEVDLQGDSDVRGTLEFRGSGEVSNRGTLTVSGVGGMALYFNYDFVNRSGGVVDIQNDSGIAVQSPDQGRPTPIQVINEAGATITKSAGGGTSVIEAPIVNAGRVSASSGQLTLAGGGTHAAGASLEASGSAAVGLQGAHTITGAVTSSGDGSIYLGAFGKPGTMTIASGGTLTNSGRFFQSGTFTVESGGKLEQAQTGGFYAFSNLNVAAGGKVDNSGSIQLDGTFVNNGDVTVKSGASISGSMGGIGSYNQQAGSTVIESAGYFSLDDGQYQQDGGSTEIKAGGTMDLRSCDPSTGACTGGTYLQTGGVTKVNGSLAADNVRLEGGELNGAGTIVGYVTTELTAANNFLGTIINPANSPGVLTIDGNFLASGAIFNIEIGGPLAGTDYDQLFVTGDATIDGGVVNFLFINGFLPQVGDTFDWLIASNPHVQQLAQLFRLEQRRLSIRRVERRKLHGHTSRGRRGRWPRRARPRARHARAAGSWPRGAGDDETTSDRIRSWHRDVPPAFRQPAMRGGSLAP